MEYPTLEYILNELSILGICADSKEQAREWMANFISTCQAIRNIGFKRLRFSAKSIKSIPLMSDYTIEMWLSDEEVNIDLQNSFRRNFTDIGSPYLEKSTTFFLEYNGKQEEAKGLSTAYLKNTIAVSFNTGTFWNTDKINLSISESGERTILFDRHICEVAQVENQKRIFENNNKHGWCGKGHQKNQSRMLCCEQEHTNFLLNTAVIQPNKPSNLCNYDFVNDKFIAFLQHEYSKYHGYHYEDELIKDSDRELNNPKNGIPKSVQKCLKALQETYYKNK